MLRRGSSTSVSPRGTPSHAEQLSAADSESTWIKDESGSVKSEPCLPASSYRIIRDSAPYTSTGNGKDNLVIWDLHDEHVDLSLYRGTRCEVLYHKSKREPLSSIQTTYLIHSASLIGPHLNKSAGPVIIHPSLYKSMTCYGSPQSLMSFLHDSRDFLGDIRLLGLSFNFTQQEQTDRRLRGSFAAITAQTAWAKLFDVLVRLNLETFVLISFDSFWKTMPWQRGAKYCFSATASSTATPADAYDSDESLPERNFLQQVTRLASVRIGIDIMGQSAEPKRKKFAEELGALIDAQVPKQRSIAKKKLPHCTCPPGVRLEATCFWNLGE